jgi:hypothetical protein
LRLVLSYGDPSSFLGQPAATLTGNIEVLQAGNSDGIPYIQLTSIIAESPSL